MFSEKQCLKTAIVLMGVLQFSQAAFLRCYNGSLHSYIVTPLSDPLAISPCINPGLPIVFYTFGYRGKVNGPATTAVISSYMEKKKKNVILLDWEQEAQSGLLGIPLGYVVLAVPNAKKIGEKLGAALIKFTKAGMEMKDVHLVGHSLGAHVMGYAGSRARDDGIVVGRITGLDPALALFEGTLAMRGLDRTCAKFVDIVHTDPGGYGTSKSAGTVDFWPNYTGSSGLQPGCPTGKYETFSSEDLCSHDRSWRFYTEALASPTAFPATAASNSDEWLANGGKSNQTIYLGDLTSTKARGNFYLRTNSEPPFGMGVEGTKPDKNQARRRRNSILTSIFKYL